MFFLLNANNFIWGSRDYSSILGQVLNTQVTCYVLDTDDLVVTSLPFVELQYLILNNVVKIENINVYDKSVILAGLDGSAFVQMRARNREILSCLDGQVVYTFKVRDTLSTSSQFSYGALEVAGINLYIGTRRLSASSYEFLVKNQRYCIFNVAYSGGNLIAGIAYFFKIDARLVIRYLCVDDSVVHCVTVVADFFGNILDVFSEDKFFMNWADFPYDAAFRTKLMTMLRGRY